jgi:molecular chaperone DnaK
MKKDAKEHESEDKQKREMVDIKNQADSLVFQGEKQIKEMESKMDAETKMKIQTALDRLKEAQKGTNVEEIKSAIDGYNAAWQEASTKMYSQATGGQPGAGQQQEGFGSQGQQQGDAGQQTQDDKKVENADFEVMDDDKK